MKTLLKLVVALLMSIAGAFVTGWFIMLMWNWFLPSIFGVTTITYMQSCGLAMVFAVLFQHIPHRRYKLSGTSTDKDHNITFIELIGEELQESDLGRAFQIWLSALLSSGFLVFVAWLIHLMM